MSDKKKLTIEDVEKIQETLGKELMRIAEDPEVLKEAEEFTREQRRLAHKDIDIPLGLPSHFSPLWSRHTQANVNHDCHQTIQQLLKHIDGQFTPYMYHNVHGDCVQVYVANEGILGDHQFPEIVFYKSLVDERDIGFQISFVNTMAPRGTEINLSDVIEQTLQYITSVRKDPEKAQEIRTRIDAILAACEVQLLAEKIHMH